LSLWEKITNIAEKKGSVPEKKKPAGFFAHDIYNIITCYIDKNH